MPDTASHTLMYHTAERTDTLAHISPAGAEKIPHRIIQAEHATGVLVNQTGNGLFHTGTQWARTPLGNNRVIPETEEEEAIQGDLRLMGAKTDWGADVS